MDGLEVGNVLHLFCRFTQPYPKEKFMVLVCREPKPLFLLINSKINKFIQSKPDLMAIQVLIDSTTHTFLDYDSYVDCTEPCSFDVQEIKEQIAADASRVKGNVSAEVMSEIIVAVKKSPMLPSRQLEWILGATERVGIS
jgi:hypothetical protein